VQITDSAGTTSFAGLLFVSGHQVNYLLPSGMADGLAQVSVLDNGAAVSNGILEVAAVAPALFTANNTGNGVASAYIQAVQPDGTFLPLELAATYDTGQQQWVPNPISFNGNNLILELYGTGFDNATTSNTKVYINNATVTVNYAGTQGQYAGEDQINVQLPSSLAGAGAVTVQAFVNNVPSNPVTITFQ